MKMNKTRIKTEINGFLAMYDTIGLLTKFEKFLALNTSLPNFFKFVIPKSGIFCKQICMFFKKSHFLHKSVIYVWKVVDNSKILIQRHLEQPLSVGCQEFCLPSGQFLDLNLTPHHIPQPPKSPTLIFLAG